MILDGVLSLLWAIATGLLLRSGGRFRHSTLSVAWGWAVAATAAWWAAWIIALIRPTSPVGDQAWYLAAILSLCPMIAALGAKRPGARVWGIFILVPLVAVLGWPAVTLWFTRGPLPPLELSTPVLVGFALVLVMGTGNYLGTRYSLSAIGTALALCCVAGSLGEWGLPFDLSQPDARRIALLLLSLSLLAAVRQSRRKTLAPHPQDVVWLDFRDSFGIVWGRRLLERINERAIVENWPCRLSDHGFAWSPDASEQDRTATEPKIDHTLRWLFRRFVDPEWIDLRLSVEQATDKRPGQIEET